MTPPLYCWPSFSFSLHLSHLSSQTLSLFTSWLGQIWLFPCIWLFLSEQWAPHFLFTRSLFLTWESPYGQSAQSLLISTHHLSHSVVFLFLCNPFCLTTTIFCRPFCLQYLQLALVTLSHWCPHFYSAAPPPLHQHLIICNLSVLSWFCQLFFRPSLFIQLFPKTAHCLMAKTWTKTFG